MNLIRKTLSSSDVRCGEGKGRNQLGHTEHEMNFNAECRNTVGKTETRQQKAMDEGEMRDASPFPESNKHLTDTDTDPLPSLGCKLEQVQVTCHHQADSTNENTAFDLAILAIQRCSADNK